ncbi:MAG: soluble lytic murein transglycosylase-like [Desulfobulbaceae bacterium]|jgi:soluble lytic murein transglycosylase-like protein|nr:MAG: soluble lytic murein transglycosylase-like [Desulfobulbaceae bacterium]
METIGKVLCLVVALLCAPSPGQAEVYTYVDAQGTRYYTNVPASGKYQLHQSQEVVISKPTSQPWPEVRIGGRRDWPKGSSEAYDLQISQCSYRYNVDPYLIKAIIRAESGFDCNAQSGKGAQGLMQLMPGTARDLNVANPFDPRANIDGGTRYFRTMLDTFNGNIPLSLAAYNAGPNLVKQTNRMPEIPETVEYVQRVLHHYKAYKGVNNGGR